jgi:hypothetical protein
MWNARVKTRLQIRKKICVVKYSYIWSKITFSKILAITDKTGIGL